MAKHNSIPDAPGFGPLVHDIAKLVRRQFEKKAGKLGLTQSQWTVISHLMQEEGINQATLAERMDIEPISLVGLLDRLEQAGWVERRPDPNDRRARKLYLTKQAQPVLQKMETIRSDVRKDAFAGIASQDQKQLIDILHKVKENLQQSSKIRPPS